MIPYYLIRKKSIDFISSLSIHYHCAYKRARPCTEREKEKKIHHVKDFKA